MKPPRALVPAALLAALLVFEMGAILLAARVRGVDLAFVIPHFFGLDYYDFWQASRCLLDGQSPYAVERYVTPPLPALANLPLALLPLDRAILAVAVANPVVVLLSCGLTAASFFGPRRREATAVLALTAVLVATSYPFYFLLDRGNIDGFVLLLLCLAVVLAERRGILAGVCLGLAIGAKVYPLLLVLPLALQRRWRALAATGVCLALMGAAFPLGFWRDFGARLAERSGYFAIQENGSLSCTFFYLGVGLHEGFGVPFRPGVWHGAAWLVYGLLLGLCVWADHAKRSRRDVPAQRAAALLYLPFMVAVPRTAFHYGLVLLLPLVPVLCWLWRERTGRGARRALAWLVLGVALSQSQAVALERLFGSVVPHVVPGAGLLLVLVGCTWLKLRT